MATPMTLEEQIANIKVEIGKIKDKIADYEVKAPNVTDKEEARYSMHLRFLAGLQDEKVLLMKQLQQRDAAQAPATVIDEIPICCWEEYRARNDEQSFPGLDTTKPFALAMIGHELPGVNDVLRKIVAEIKKLGTLKSKIPQKPKKISPDIIEELKVIARKIGPPEKSQTFQSLLNVSKDVDFMSERAKSDGPILDDPFLPENLVEVVMEKKQNYQSKSTPKETPGSRSIGNQWVRSIHNVWRKGTNPKPMNTVTKEQFDKCFPTNEGNVEEALEVAPKISKNDLVLLGNEMKAEEVFYDVLYTILLWYIGAEARLAKEKDVMDGVPLEADIQTAVGLVWGCVAKRFGVSLNEARFFPGLLCKIGDQFYRGYADLWVPWEKEINPDTTAMAICGLLEVKRCVKPKYIRQGCAQLLAGRIMHHHHDVFSKECVFGAAVEVRQVVTNGLLCYHLDIVNGGTNDAPVAQLRIRTLDNTMTSVALFMAQCAGVKKQLDDCNLAHGDSNPGEGNPRSRHGSGSASESQPRRGKNKKLRKKKERKTKRSKTDPKERSGEDATQITTLKSLTNAELGATVTSANRFASVRRREFHSERRQDLHDVACANKLKQGLFTGIEQWGRFLSVVLWLSYSNYKHIVEDPL